MFANEKKITLNYIDDMKLKKKQIIHYRKEPLDISTQGKSVCTV